MLKRALVVAALIAALVAGGVAYQRAAATSVAVPASQMDVTAESTSPAPAASAVDVVKVRSVHGKVERRSPNGEWAPLSAEDILAPDDMIRTGPHGSAEIDLGGSVDATVAEDTEITIGQVSATLSRVQLDDGRLASVVHGSEGFRFRVEVRGRDAFAETSAGRIGVMKRGDGPVAVAAEEGSARVTAEGQTVEVRSGEQTIVESGVAPSKPTKIPSSLYLKLGKSVRVPVGETRARIAGATSPGAAVRVDRAHARAGKLGRFSHSVVLRDGSNEIVIEVEDALGRRVQKKLPLIRVEPSARTRVEPPPERDVDGSVRW